MSLREGVVIRTRPDGQKGMFTLNDVEQGEILIFYDGPTIGHSTRYSIQIEENKHIEGTPESNAYLNHCCAPNAYVDWSGVYLRAKRDIRAGEELTCNYLTTDWEFHEKFTCKCGSPQCYGEMKGFRFLTRDQQKELEPYVPEFMKKRIAKSMATSGR